MCGKPKISLNALNPFPSTNTPKAPSPADQYRAQLEYERQREADAKKAEEERAAAAEVEKAKKQQIFDTAKSSATADAINRAIQQSAMAGVNFSTTPSGEGDQSLQSPIGTFYYSDPAMQNYVSSVIDALTGETTAIPNLAETPATYYSPNTAETALTNALSKARSSTTQQLQSGPFAPGYSTSYIPDTADDAILDAILSAQRSEAEQAIKNAQGRGLLNQTGYQSAMDKLASQNAGARSQLDTIGNSALASARGALDQYSTDVFGRAGTLGYGQTLDFSNIGNELQSKAGAALGGLEGDIRSRLGETALFQAPSLIQTGGIAQQQYNPADSLASALALRKKEDEKRRGIGSQGVF